MNKQQSCAHELNLRTMDGKSTCHDCGADTTAINKPEGVSFVRATHITAVCFEELTAVLNNGVVVPVVHAFDSEGEEIRVEGIRQAATFTAGSEEQGWFTDRVNGFVDIERDITALTNALCRATVVGLTFGAYDANRSLFVEALEIVKQYDNDSADALNRRANHRWGSAVGHPEDDAYFMRLDKNFAERDIEAKADTSEVYLKDIPKSEIVYDNAALLDGKNQPSKEHGLLGRVIPFSRRGFDVVSPQPDFPEGHGQGALH